MKLMTNLIKLRTVRSRLNLRLFNKKTRKLTFRVRAVLVFKEHDNIADSTQSSTKSNSEVKRVKLITKYCAIKSNDNRIILRKVVEKHTVYDLILQKKKGMQAKRSPPNRKPEILLEVLTETILHSAPQMKKGGTNPIDTPIIRQVSAPSTAICSEWCLNRDFSQFSLGDNQSGPVTSEMIRDVPLPHGHTTKYAEKFVQEMENTNLLLLTGLVGKAETSHEGIGRTSLLDYVFCSPQLLNYASNYFTWPRYMNPFSDRNLITIDFKLPNSYFQSAKQAVGPQLKFEWKRKVDISPVAHPFPWCLLI
eukprot:g50494.t1